MFYVVWLILHQESSESRLYLPCRQQRSCDSGASNGLSYLPPVETSRGSHDIQNSVMQEFCREIIELAEALIAEGRLITSAISKSMNKSEKDTMSQILVPAKQHFGGMENMIRLKDRWLVDVTVRVLCKILTRLRENGHEIHPVSRKLITDACLPTSKPSKYVRSTNLTDQQRAELLQALGQSDDEVQIIQLGIASDHPSDKARDKAMKQSKLDAWSKSGTGGFSNKASKSNRDDVLALRKSIDSPILKQLDAHKAREKAKSVAQAQAQAKAKAKTRGPDLNAMSALKESRAKAKAEKQKRDPETIARAKQLRGELVPGEGSSLSGLGMLGREHT